MMILYRNGCYQLKDRSLNPSGSNIWLFLSLDLVLDRSLFLCCIPYYLSHSSFSFYIFYINLWCNLMHLFSLLIMIYIKINVRYYDVRYHRNRVQVTTQIREPSLSGVEHKIAKDIWLQSVYLFLGQLSPYYTVTI
jgi:hypothetical protein